jgi:signal peptide peptidase SppA
MTVQTKRPIKSGELLAIMPEALHGKPGAMYWDSYVTVPYNARMGTVAVVSIRGSLDHHPGWGCDSYEAIVRRAKMAFAGEDDRPRYMRENYDEEPPPPVAPSAVVLRIDSPGGLVSGLNECVFALRQMAADAGIPLIAYADELAASAAYALACACEEIVCPPSAILGSIGVISTLFDQTAADEKMGVNVVTLTSGARKSDGHPHVAISEAAVAAEQARVDKMALQFYRVVETARELTVSDIRGFEAGIFLGHDAVKAGIADEVMSFDALLQLLNSDTYKQNSVADREKSGSTSNAKGTDMSKLALTNQIARAEAALKTEKDPAKRTALTAAIDSSKAALAAFTASQEAMKKTKIKYEETSEEKPDPKPKEEGDDGDEEATTSEKPADDDDEEEDDDKDEKASASAALRLAEATTGRKGARAIAALESRLAQGEIFEKRLAALEKTNAAEAKEHSISAALSAREITPHEAKTLAGKKASYVREYIADRKGKIVVHSDDDETVIRPAAGGSSATTLPPEVEKQIQAGLAGLTSLSKDERDKIEATLRKTHLDEHQRRMAAGLNGAAGRV